jgi:hypothetical protein
MSLKVNRRLGIGKSLLCSLKSDPPCCMAFRPDGGVRDAQEETQGGRDCHEAVAAGGADIVGVANTCGSVT